LFAGRHRNFCMMIKHVGDLQSFKTKALKWAASFDVFCVLDSNNFHDAYSKFDMLIAAGAKDELAAKAGNAFDELEKFREKHPGWVTGFFWI